MANKTRQQTVAYRLCRKRNLALATGLVAALIMGWVVPSLAGGTKADSTIGAYAPEDVVHDNPINVVHQMGPGPTIPFLPKDQPQPKIVVPTGIYNFGSLGPKEVVTRTFVIRNVGKAPLTISRAYTTCGCTTAEITARVIPPGKVALATIRFDAGFHDARGKIVQRGLIIENNDPSHWKAEIWTQAAIRWK